MNAIQKRATAPLRTAAPISKNSPQSTVSNARLQQEKGGELPRFLKDLISSPPKHGDGVHQWLFTAARQLHAHRDEQEMIHLLEAAVQGCGRHVPHSEIAAAVEDSRSCAWQPNGRQIITSKPVPKWPSLDGEKRKCIIESGIDLADLWDKSPTICTLDSTDSEFFADMLFSGDPLLCVGRNMANFHTAPREEFRGKLSELSLIVPSPMSALTGARKSDGKLSAHTLNNTGPRHYLVTEFDSGTPDEQAALIWHLRDFAPLVVVLSSGGKSLHAWWNCKDVDNRTVARFFRYAVSLGADPATWTRSQFVRLPQGWRAEKKRRQEVYFFDHEAAEGWEVSQ